MKMKINKKINSVLRYFTYATDYPYVTFFKYSDTIDSGAGRQLDNRAVRNFGTVGIISWTVNGHPCEGSRSQNELNRLESAVSGFPRRPQGHKTPC